MAGQTFKTRPSDTSDLFVRGAAMTPKAPVDFALRNFRKDYPFIPREYQKSIAVSALGAGKDGKPLSTLVVLPPSKGKTLIAGMVAGHKLDMGKILFLGHNGPLVRQQYGAFKAMLELPESEIREVIGMEMPSKKRAKLYAQTPRLIVATSQTIERDLVRSRFSFEGFSLLISDETHYTVGEHSHNLVARAATESGVPILGLTASPGDNMQKINEILCNLGINNIEIRTNEDEDIRPYNQEIDSIIEKVDLPRFFQFIRYRLYELTSEPFSELKKMGMLEGAQRELLETDLFEGDEKERRVAWFEKASKLMTFEVLEQIEQRTKDYDRGRDSDEVSFGQLSQKQRNKRMAMSFVAELRFYYELLNVFETQSRFAGRKYIENHIFGLSSAKRINKIRKEVREQERPLTELEIRRINRLDRKQSMAYKKRIRSNKKFISMYRYIAKEDETLPEHPKMDLFRQTIFERYPDTRFIVFSEFRDQVGYLRRYAESLGVTASELLGKKDDVTAADQIEAIESFKSGRSRILVATRAGREGLDLPSASVIDYDQVGTGIASIQRDGRAGRNEPATVIKFVTLGTADETALYRAAHARKAMERDLKKLQRTLVAERSDKFPE